MHILNNDNEENSIICLRIIFDLHKNYRRACSITYTRCIYSMLTTRTPVILRRCTCTCVPWTRRGCQADDSKPPLALSSPCCLLTARCGLTSRAQRRWTSTRSRF